MDEISKTVEHFRKGAEGNKSKLKQNTPIPI
jgi:hypothetical protein